MILTPDWAQLNLRDTLLQTQHFHLYLLTFVNDRGKENTPACLRKQSRIDFPKQEFTTSELDIFAKYLFSVSCLEYGSSIRVGTITCFLKIKISGRFWPEVDQQWRSLKLFHIEGHLLRCPSCKCHKRWSQRLNFYTSAGKNISQKDIERSILDYLVSILSRVPNFLKSCFTYSRLGAICYLPLRGEGQQQIWMNKKLENLQDRTLKLASVMLSWS